MPASSSPAGVFKKLVRKAAPAVIFSERGTGQSAGVAAYRNGAAR